MTQPIPKKTDIVIIDDPTPEQRDSLLPICVEEIDNKEIFTEFTNSEGIMPYRDFVKTTFAYSHSINMATINQTLDLLHIWGAIAGEYIEFQNELELHRELKILESTEKEISDAYFAAEKELGDLCYYIQMAANNINISLPTVNPLFNEDNERAFENFIDAVKKKVFYGHEVDLHLPVVEVWSQLNYLANSIFNKPIEYFIMQNKTKLMKRYPLGKFRSEDAAEKKDNLT